MNDQTISLSRADYRHGEHYRVRYSDLDTYRHVNNKSFLTYVEDARVCYLVDVAGFTHHHEGGAGIMVVHVSIDYLSQINAFEQVEVLTRCARIGTRSFTLHHLLLAGAVGDRAASGTATVDTAGESSSRLAAKVTTVFATVDIQAGRSRDNDPGAMERIAAYERVAPAR
jgi:acyl-CoA thioester hydrolase